MAPAAHPWGHTTMRLQLGTQGEQRGVVPTWLPCTGRPMWRMPWGMKGPNLEGSHMRMRDQEVGGSSRWSSGSVKSELRALPAQGQVGE